MPAAAPLRILVLGVIGCVVLQPTKATKECCSTLEKWGDETESCVFDLLHLLWMIPGGIIICICFVVGALTEGGCRGGRTSAGAGHLEVSYCGDGGSSGACGDVGGAHGCD